MDQEAEVQCPIIIIIITIVMIIITMIMIIHLNRAGLTVSATIQLPVFIANKVNEGGKKSRSNFVCRCFTTSSKTGGPTLGNIDKTFIFALYLI